jgi:hypothetical protein
MRSARFLVLGLLLLLPAGSLAQEEGLLDRSTSRALERIARDLAAQGLEEDCELVQDVLLKLGHPAKARSALREACAKARRRARPSAGRAKSLRHQLEKICASLHERLESAAADEWVPLAKQIVRLDGADETAREMLEHVRTESGWLCPEKAETLEGQRRMEDVLRRARKREFPVELGDSDVAILAKVCGRPGRKAVWSNVEVHGPFPDVRLRRVLLETLRVRSIAQELLSGSPDLRAIRKPRRFLLLPSVTAYRQAVHLAVEEGRIPADEKERALDMAAVWYGSPHRDMLYRFQAELPAVASFTYYISDWKYTDGSCGRRTQPCLRAGHVNWACLSYLGVPMLKLRWVEETTKRVAGAGSGTEAGDRLERERHERLGRSGILGCRTWMAYLARRREDPPWTAAMVGQEGQIEALPLLKTTLVVAYLQELGLFAEIVSATACKNTGGAATVDPVLFEEALKKPLAEFEACWRRWLLPEDMGLLARLGGDRKATGPTPLERAALAELERIRSRAFAGRDLAEPPKLMILPELSRGAMAHARYLTLHPEQLRAWPDAHEEWPDREGFSPEGSAAGLRSVIAPGSTSPKDAIDGWMGTFYHRLPLLAPGLLAIGYGQHEGTAVLDSGSLVETWAREGVYVVWPPQGAKGVPLGFNPELPHPVPGEDQATWGYPITIQGVLTDSRFTMALYEGKVDAAHRVPCHLSTPDAPTNPELAPGGAACLIPKTRLKPGCTYVVEALHLTGGETLRWSFRTGR